MEAPSSPAFTSAMSYWRTVGCIKPALRIEDATNYHIAVVSKDWSGVADWFDESGGEYRYEGFTRAESAQAYVYDQCNFFERMWVDGMLVILTED